MYLNLGLSDPKSHSLYCYFVHLQSLWWASLVALVVKSPSTNVGDIRDVGSIPGWGRSPGEGNGNPLQYSCLGSPMDRGAWRAIVHQTILAKSRT